MPKPLVQATGRRKSSRARVRLYSGTGRVLINDRPLEDFFPTMAQRIRVLEPLRVAQIEGRYDAPGHSGSCWTARRPWWPEREIGSSSGSTRR